MAYHRWLQQITPRWPEGGPFDLITVDLPLRWVAYSPKGEARSPQHHYPTMEPASLVRLLRPMLAAVAAKNCVSGWWVYGPRLPDTLKVLTKSGFTFTTQLLTWIKTEKIGAGELDGWVKIDAFGTGKTTRKGAEDMWGAKRGHGVRIRDHSVDQRVFAPRGKHSQKPDEAYHALERLYGDVRRLELFGTKLRPGWAVWGHIEGSEFVERLRAADMVNWPPHDDVKIATPVSQRHPR
jgi:N6-adenosine-specific RNA methylase IME4